MESNVNNVDRREYPDTVAKRSGKSLQVARFGSKYFKMT